MWGARGTLPDIDLDNGEAVLVRRAAPFRWFVPEPGEHNEIVLRVAEDGTGHRYTLDLRWEPYDVLGSDLQEVPEGTAMHRIADVVERMRESWRDHWPGRHYFAIFARARHVVDLANAQYLVRPTNGHDSDLGESFTIFHDWQPCSTLRDFAMGKEFLEVKIPIAEPEAEYLVEVLRKRTKQWQRAYGRPGN